MVVPHSGGPAHGDWAKVIFDAKTKSLPTRFFRIENRFRQVFCGDHRQDIGQSHRPYRKTENYVVFFEPALYLHLFSTLYIVTIFLSVAAAPYFNRVGNDGPLRPARQHRAGARTASAILPWATRRRPDDARKVKVGSGYSSMYETQPKSELRQVKITFQRAPRNGTFTPSMFRHP